MEQKVAKLETAVDAVEKSLEIRLEKEMLGLERKMMQKFGEIQANVGRNSQR
jgi:hypothetical protein